MKGKKNIVNHAIALVILLVGFILCRYTFFDIHGMKEFPKVLLVLGLVVTAISALTKKMFLPYFVSMGYIIGFVFGFVFQVSRIDANGISVNNLCNHCCNCYNYWRRSDRLFYNRWCGCRDYYIKTSV